MTPILLQLDLADGIRRCASVPARKVLILPAEAASSDALLDLVTREQRGYREVELARDLQRLARLDAEIAAVRANGPVSINPRTDQAEQSPGMDPVRERQARELRAAIDAHRTTLAALDTPQWRDDLSGLLERFELVPAGTAVALDTADLLAEVRTNSYGLLDDPEVRLIQRQIMLGLDEPDDGQE
jgi:hypothetical protein